MMTEFDVWRQKLQLAEKEDLLRVCHKLLDELQSRSPMREAFKDELLQIKFDDYTAKLSAVSLIEGNVPVPSANVIGRLPYGIEAKKYKFYALDFIDKDLRVNELQIENYLGNKNNTILFLGEGDFTFSAAVAALRKTWTNIIQSDLKYKKNVVHPACRESCRYVELFWQVMTNLSDEVTMPKAVKEFVDLDWQKMKRIEVDATLLNDIDECTKLQIKALYFQCPWTKKELLPEMILKFFESAANIQKKDDFLFLGICTHELYRDSYGLKPDTYKGYSLAGVDTAFCTKMMARGYRHQTGETPDQLGKWGNLNHLIRDNLITLCFLKN